MPRPKNPERETLRARIQGAGLRATMARVAVYERLLRAKRPLSHADLVEDLVPEGFDRATIYRNLMDLTEAGLVSRTDLGDHVWRFERRDGEGAHRDEHPHFVCVDCGDVSCLPGVELQVTAARGAPRSVRRRRVEVQLKGRCDRCEAPS
jgi:Fur family transcriptional regulator, ferric uptake regulator